MSRSRPTQVGLVVAAVAILAVAFLVLRGSDSTSEEQGSTTVAQTTTNAEPRPSTRATTPGRTTTAPAASAPAAPTVPLLRAGANRRIEVEAGETVRFRVRNSADVAEEVHVHGYDRYVDVPPGETVAESFEANLEGAFEIELHGSGEQIATLEVRPG